MTPEPAVAPRGLDRYRIERLIGAGGMGEVYEALDLQLGRRVALKILPAASAHDRGRVARFIREAQTASALNHPAIVTVYDAGTWPGEEHYLDHYLVMELLDGETLGLWAKATRDRAKRLELLAQVADGLAAAHAAGIVHRDLKPENIVVARGGYAKIVDFGIAKLAERPPGPSAGSDTAPSSIIGTAGYMAPEQVAAGEVDWRADVFAFGCVLHAVMAGRPPFAREGSVATMHAILNDEPPALADPELQRIARRCLAKDPEERYQSMRDVALDLRDAIRAVPVTSTRRRWTVAVLAAGLLIAASLAVFLLLRRPPTQPPPQATMLRLTHSGNITCGTISPDGNYVIHADESGDTESISVRQIATGRTVQITPPAPLYHYMIVVSPDGNYVYYSASLRSEPNVADVFRIPILGGPPKKVASDIEFHFSLSPDGKLLAFRRFSAVTRESALWLGDLEAGTERALLRWHGADRIGDPSFEPDGRQVAFRGRHGGQSKRGQAFLIDIATGEIKPFEAPKGWPSSINGFVWLPDASGILACVADSHQPSQVWQLNRDGSSRKLTSDLAFYQEISVAADGKAFVALRNEQSSNLVLVPLDRPAEMSPLTSGIGNYDGMGGARWLSDREIVYGSFAGGVQSINIAGIDRRESRELATGQFWNIRPSPDGRLVGAVAISDRGSDLVVFDAAGGPPRQITHGSNAESFDWMPDGTGVVYLSSDSVQAAWLQPLAGGPPRRLTQMPVNGVRVSPDGTRLLLRMRSTTPGTPLWRTAIVPLAGGEPQFYPVPRAGGPAQLEWAPDGHAFTYCEYANGVPNLWLQPLEGSAPRQLTKFESGQIYGYGLSRDGKSAVVARGEQSRDLVLIRDFR